MLRRGGLRNQPKLTEDQVTDHLENIRKAQQAKTQEMVNEGKKVKKVGQGESHQGEQVPDSKVGECLDVAPCKPESPPREFTSIFPTE